MSYSNTPIRRNSRVSRSINDLTLLGYGEVVSKAEKLDDLP